MNYVDIKFLPMTKGDLILSLDRLTRFKYPDFKYYRVFNEILSKYLLSPKLNKVQMQKLLPSDYKSLIEKIWNASVEKLLPKANNSGFVNKLISEEEYSSYNLSDEMKELIALDLNYDGVLELIKKDNCLPVNLKRLIMQKNTDLDKKSLRTKYHLKFPIEKVVVCEGITEEILLPAFASKCGYDFNQSGVHLISAGGKNQVAKLYCELREELQLPVFVLLDADAEETSKSIERIKRPQDRIHVIQCGEFEDLFSLFLIKRTINNKYKNILQCNVSDFKRGAPMTKVLCEYFRINNLGDFQKADFAKEISQNINECDLTQELIGIVDEIMDLS